MSHVIVCDACGERTQGSAVRVGFVWAADYCQDCARFVREWEASPSPRF